MSDSSKTPWSNNSNAPHISSELYLEEKYNFAGYFIGLISYGVAVALFFQCMGVLLNPVKPIERGIKWSLIIHTVAIFSFLTTIFAICIIYLPTEYIDNREYPAVGGNPPGPLGYQATLSNDAAATVYDVMFPLNQWLADGLLLYRCYVIYSMNHWAMAFPCLIYLASVAISIPYIYGLVNSYSVVLNDLGIAYVSLWISPKVILTLMIVTRIVLHSRNFRRAIGASASDTSSGLYTAAVALLIESCTFSAVSYLLLLVPWAVGSSAVDLFTKVIAPVQVIASYLIILRVANRRAVTTDTLSDPAEPIRFISQGTTDGDGSLPDGGDPTNAMGVEPEAPGGLGAGAEGAIEEVPL